MVPRTNLRVLYARAISRTYPWRASAAGQRVTAPLRLAVSGCMGALFRLRARRLDPGDTIVVAGSARSGTSWLAQALVALPGRCLVFEPLATPGIRERYGVASGSGYLDPGAPWPAGADLLRGLCSGRVVPPGALVHNNPLALARARSLVVKLTRASRWLPWMARNLDLRGMIQIVRHPCAVVASQLRRNLHPRRGVLVQDRAYVEQQLPHLLPLVDALEHQEQYLALAWAIDQHASLRHQPLTSLRRVSYEALVLRPEDTLAQLCRFLGLPPSAAALQRLGESSLSAGGWSAQHATATAEERLGGWKRRLSRQQAERVLAVVRALGITGFGPETVPSPDRIGVARQAGQEPAGVGHRRAP